MARPVFSLASGFLAIVLCGVASAQTPFKLGDLVEPFTPPSLEELEKSVTWRDMPVRDAAVERRAAEAKSPPKTSVADALKLKNENAGANAKILDALGRMPLQDADADYEGEINRLVYGDVNSVNPLLLSSTVEFDVVGLTGVGLFGFDKQLKPFASKDSVVSWQTSEDGLYDKVVMRNDMTWSDGEPFTARDVVFSYLAIMTEAVPVPAQRSGTDKLKLVHAYDDHTLVFFHKAPLATNVWNVNFSIIPKHVYEKTIAEDPTLRVSAAHLALEKDPVVGGPYRIKERVNGQSIVLERREESYMHNGKQVRDKPYFKTIRFRVRPNPGVALQSILAGDVDEMSLTPEQWLKQTTNDQFYKNATKVTGEDWTEFHFAWNNKRPFFSDKRVRQAMSYAFDHQQMLKVLRFGLDMPATGPFHPNSPWHPKTPAKPYVQDFDKAEALLDAAGWKDSDKDGIRDKMINGKKTKFEFSVMVVNKDDRIKICTLLQDSLDQIGIRCKVDPQDFPVVIDRSMKRDFDASFGGWGSGTDPDTSENIFGLKEDGTPQERNYVDYINPEISKLFEAGRKEFDLEKRRAIYQKIHEILWEDQPYTWLFYQSSYYAFSKKMRGYEFSPRGPFHFSPGFGAIWRPEMK